MKGEGSLREISKKYGKVRREQLRQWDLWYNPHKEIKGSSSAKGRKITEKERVEIVALCIEHEQISVCTIPLAKKNC